MKIPIFNSIYQNKLKKIQTKKIDIDLLNNLDLKKVNEYRYPSIKILKKISNNTTLFETVIISANDELVDLYIKNKIKFLDINKNLNKILKFKKYSNLIKRKPKKISDIIKLSEEVRLKTRNLCIQ
jgi:1-deoxy-D-xylulose 5-phosphate reductoisomerase